ncbi:MAG: hypothetical protein HXL58_03030 [Solobacterium sp.]|nr:hypothetical protein [Solobacterium sp.]
MRIEIIKRTESRVVLDIESDYVNPLLLEKYMKYGKSVEDVAVEIVQNIQNVKSFHIEPKEKEKVMSYVLLD